jgi:NitT/TauT family transport system substrate-binding protein
LALALTLLLAAESLAAPIRIGHTGPTGQQLPIFVAQYRGIFKKYGLDTELIAFQNGPLMVQSLLAGELQFTEGGTVTLVDAKVAGSDVVTLAVYVDTLPYTLVAAEKIKSPSQLKGKRLGVSRLGAISDISLRMALQSSGIDGNKDVSILGIGDSPTRLAALKAGSVDATVISPPLTIMARKLGFNMLLHFQDVGIKWAFNTIDTTTSYARNNREITLNVLKGVIEGIAYVYKNKDESLAVLSKRLNLNDREALEETYNELLKILQKRPFSSDQGIQLMIDTTSRRNPKARQFKPQDIVDMQYLKELEQTGFFEKIYK